MFACVFAKRPLFALVDLNVLGSILQAERRILDRLDAMSEREIMRVRGGSVRDSLLHDPRLLASARVRSRGIGKKRFLFPRVEPEPNVPQLIRLRRFPYGLFPDRPQREHTRYAFERVRPHGPLSLREVLAGCSLGDRR